MAISACVGLAIATAAPAHAEAPPASTLPFEIQNGRGADGLIFETTASQAAPTRWRRTIRVVAAGEVKQSTARLRIADCVLATDAGASTTIASIALPAQDLLPGASIPILLEAAFPRGGVYKGELQLVQESRLRIVPIRVTVAAPVALPIKAHGGGAVSLTGDEPAAWRVEVGNTGTESLLLGVSIVAIARLDQADGPKTRLKVSVGAAIPPPPWVPIAPGAVGHISVATGAINEPGIYEVETMVLDPTGSYAPSSVATIVYRRRSYWCAALAIAIGAVIASILRWYFEGGKRRVELSARIALLQQRIRNVCDTSREGMLNEAAKRLASDVDDLRRTLWRSYWRLTDQEERFSRAEQRSLLLQQIEDAVLMVDRLDPARQPPLRKQLDDALAAVRDDLGDTVIVKQREAVAQLGTLSAWRDQLGRWLAELDEQLRLQLPAASAQLRRELGAAFTEIRKLLAIDQLGAAHDQLEQLQTSLTQLVTAELQRLTSAEQPPLGVGANAWKEACKLIQYQLAVVGDDSKSPDERKTALGCAQQRYIQLLVTGLADDAERKASEPPVSGSGQVLLAKEVQRLHEIARELRDAIQHDPAVAAQRYEALREEVEEAGLSESGNAPIGAIDARLRTRVLQWFLPRDDIRRQASGAAPDLRPVQRIATTTRWAVNIVVLALAVASGVKALWIGDLSWDAWLTAFLWGAGVQTAGNALVDLSAVRARLAGTPTP